MRSTWITWLRLSLVTFVLLVLIFIGLPALLLAFQVPSFQLGIKNAFWIAEWTNNADSSGIQFNVLVNVLVLVIIAVLVGLLIALFQHRRH